MIVIVYMLIPPCLALLGFVLAKEARLARIKSIMIFLEASNNVLRGARSPAHSSSAQSNLIETEKTAAWARLQELVAAFIEWTEEEGGAS